MTILEIIKNNIGVEEMKYEKENKNINYYKLYINNM